MKERRELFNRMNHQKSELYFLLILLAGIFVLAFFIFKPFLYALILAMVFAAVFEPVHKKVLVLTRERRALAALLTTVLVLIAVVAPIIFFGVQIFQEATGLYSSLVESGGATDLSRSVGDAAQSLKRFFPVSIEFSPDVNQYLKPGLNWLLSHLGPLFANVAKVMLGAFIFLVALYYLFKDGHKLKRAVITFSPLQDIHDETIFNKLALAINSVIKGSLAVALVQGILTAVGFAIFGVPNAALWGSVAAVAALIPGVGTALVLVPAIIFLFLSGETFSAVGLLLWGVAAVGLIDNFLGPKLVGQGTRLHPFLILLSILGGIGFFGPLGFLLGPLVLSLLFALLEIYLAISKEHKSL
ncbi:MAG: AI-2E family transporter [Candidatus Moranbacteria bacterium]|nr:AI-2E family transporter [Candidatus Moranbacteria bacterium]